MRLCITSQNRNTFEFSTLIKCKGKSDAVLICRTRDAISVGRLLDRFEVWRTDEMQPTSHLGIESAFGKGEGL